MKIKDNLGLLNMDDVNLIKLRKELLEIPEDKRNQDDKDTIEYINMQEANMKKHQEMQAERLVIAGIEYKSSYYDPWGNPIDLWTWSNYSFDPEWKRIGEDIIDGYLISTVWLGLNHGWFQNKILIFETMIFRDDGKDNIFQDYQERYSTLDEARNGHLAAKFMVMNYIGNKEHDVSNPFKINGENS